MDGHFVNFIQVNINESIKSHQTQSRLFQWPDDSYWINLRRFGGISVFLWGLQTLFDSICINGQKQQVKRQLVVFITQAISTSLVFQYIWLILRRKKMAAVHFTKIPYELYTVLYVQGKIHFAIFVPVLTTLCMLGLIWRFWNYSVHFCKRC